MHAWFLNVRLWNTPQENRTQQESSTYIDITGTPTPRPTVLHVEGFHLPRTSRASGGDIVTALEMPYEIQAKPRGSKSER